MHPKTMLAPWAVRGAMMAAAIGGCCDRCSAVVLVNSHGFESPPFSDDFLEGQNGWVTTGVGGSSAVVQTTTVKTGERAVRVDRASLSSRFWADPLDQAQSGRFVSIDWDMLVELTGSQQGFGPFLGVNAFDDSVGIAQLAGFGVDATTGDVLFQEGQTGFLAETAFDITPGVWSHFRIELDFQLDQYRAYFDGVLVATTGFIDDSAVVEIDTITDADIAAVPAGADPASQMLEGVAYFDNFLVRDGLRADYNSDGVVDTADFTVWRDQLGQTGFALAADGDADGVVDINDYNLWKASFSESNLIAGASGDPTPEACTLWLMAPLAFCIGVGKRRDHRR